MNKEDFLALGGILELIALAVAPIAAWLTHIFWTVGALFGDDPVTTQQYVLMALGAFIPPIGVIHGLVLWF